MVPFTSICTRINGCIALFEVVTNNFARFRKFAIIFLIMIILFSLSFYVSILLCSYKKFDLFRIIFMFTCIKYVCSHFCNCTYTLYFFVCIIFALYNLFSTFAAHKHSYTYILTSAHTRTPLHYQSITNLKTSLFRHFKTSLFRQRHFTLELDTLQVSFQVASSSIR